MGGELWGNHMGEDPGAIGNILGNALGTLWELGNSLGTYPCPCPSQNKEKETGSFMSAC